MIKVYVDWNVMAQLKHGQYPELLDVLHRKHQLQVVYSTSHISDILVSYSDDEQQQIRIREDLDFISTLTDNWCAHSAEKQVAIGQLDPHQLFNDKVEQQNGLGGEGPLNYALSLLPEDSPMRAAMMIYMNMPMPESMRAVYDDPFAAKHMRENYPGLEENPTVGNMMKVFWTKNKSLNQTEAYKTLRETIQRGLGINKDKMFGENSPFTAMDKAYNQIAQLGDLDLSNLIRNDNSPSWFQDISHNYLLLDLHGYQQDKIKVNEKNKDTMRNTIDDGFHAAFASTCDFYLTNDTRAINKAKQVYEKLEINTRICRPEEFINFGKKLLLDSPEESLTLWLKLLPSKEFEEHIKEDGSKWSKLQLECFLFDYFNKIYLVYDIRGCLSNILLSKDKPTNYQVITVAEVKALINKLNIAFQATDENRIDPDSATAEPINYQWRLNKLLFTLELNGNFLQLYLGVAGTETSD